MEFPRRLAFFLIFCFVFSYLVTACGQTDLSDQVIEDKWALSAHSDIESKSFTYWDDKDPPEIPVDCAKCHSTFGYNDFLGNDGATPGQVDRSAPVGTTIECEACHTEAAESKHIVVMPSGTRIDRLGQQSNCMECHQGRTSSRHVAEVIAGLPMDALDSSLELPKIHNNAAGATFYGTTAQGGGEYPNREYVGKFYHGFDSCITCHDSHTLEVVVENCSACHFGATTVEAVRDIRLSNIDYDGDGDISEGLSGEIETMMEKLLFVIRLYAATTDGAELIIYDGQFLTDSEEEYSTWTPRLLQAAYNYRYADEDQGSYSHNPKYIMQLLYDSLQDLDGDTRGMNRP